ncbi:MAG: hypothetical protein KY476_16640 [Planctomycetes bacterium]|nr:hypothetical protein [Planctomycetota bacterium]
MLDPSDWLRELAEAAAGCLRPADVAAPLGCHVYHNRARDEWELTLFFAATQIVGGPFDGRTTVSKFTADIAALQDVFDEVRVVGWQNARLGSDDALGPQLSIEGTYRGCEVWLRIPANPPERFAPGRLAHAYELRLEDVWSR